MIQFHPDDNMLLEYSAGSLDKALAVGVKAHLQMCSCCREKVSRFNAIGSNLCLAPKQNASNDTEHEETESSFNALMSRIRQMEAEKPTEAEEKRVTYDHLPKGLPKLLAHIIPKNKRLKWRRVSPSLKQANLTTGQDNYEVCLHKIAKGGSVAQHDHGGIEVTLVLQGAFSDESGTYRAGDFIVRHPGDKHRPRATENQDCLCLSVLEAPVKLTGMVGQIVNPFLSFNPA